MQEYYVYDAAASRMLWQILDELAAHNRMPDCCHRADQVPSMRVWKMHFAGCNAAVSMMQLQILKWRAAQNRLLGEAVEAKLVATSHQSVGKQEQCCP